MFRRITTVFLVVCMLLTVCTTSVLADDKISVSAKIQTRITPNQCTEYKFAYHTTPPFYSTYTPFNPGDSLKFVLDIQESGIYDLNMYAARYAQQDIYISVQIDTGEKKSVFIPASSGYYDFSRTISAGTYELTEGLHTLNVSDATAGMHLNSFEIFKRTNPDDVNDFSKTNGTYVGPYKDITLPSIIECEKYDIGGGAYHSIDNSNDVGIYRKDEPMDVYSKDSDADDYYLGLAVGEYAKYTFNVSHSAVYSMCFELGGTAQFSVYIDDQKYPLKYNVYENDFGKTRPVDIYFEEGSHNIKIECTEYKFISRMTSPKVDKIIFSISSADIDNSLKVSDLSTGGYDVLSSEEPDYNSLDKPNNVYRELYVSPDGNDLSDGTKASPFKTLGRALNELSEITPAMTGDIIVNVASGYYELDKMLEIKNEHGGKNGYNVIFRGESGREKPVISGGQKVTGWEKHSDKIWKAHVPDVDEVRNFYVNDYPAVRARSKYIYRYEEDFYLDETNKEKTNGFITNSVNFPHFEKPEHLETMWRFTWQMSIHPVKDIIYREDNTAAIVMDEPSWGSTYAGAANYMPDVGRCFYLENALELLTDPGEFYFDRDDKMIYYYPYDEEDITTAETFVGKIEGLVDVRGCNKDSRVKDIIFDNLSFKYGKWDEVSTYGIASYQADRVYNAASGVRKMKMGSPAQFNVNNAEDVVIKNCLFTCLGSSALFLTDSVKDVKIDGNVIRDVAGSALSIGSFLHTDNDELITSGKTTHCENFMVSNNVIRRAANEYTFQCGIAIYYEENINIINNDIQELPYTGISAGWGWHKKVQYTPHNNINIKNNRIGNVLKTMLDGAPIYTLGNLGSCEIANNYLYGNGIGSPTTDGVYTDCGTSNAIVHDNVVEATHSGYWAHMQTAEFANEHVRHYDNYATSSKTLKPSDDAKYNLDYTAPTIIREGMYPQKALDIIDKAGVSSEYKHLLAYADLPEWRIAKSDTVPLTLFDYNYKAEPKFGWIEAEDFIPGDNGETYYDVSNVWNNNDYRNEGVGLIVLKPKSGTVNGLAIHECAKGEWMTYAVNVPKDGIYTFKVNYGHGSSTPEKISVYIDNKLVLNEVGLPKGESGWSGFVVASFDGIELKAGNHILKYRYDGGGHYVDALGLFYPDDDAPVVKNDKAIEKAETYDETVIVRNASDVKRIQFGKKIPKFKDTLNHYAENDIEYMHTAGIVNGVSKDMFAPDMELTFEQAAWICMRALGIWYDENAWQDTAIEMGLIDVKQTGNRKISREEYAALLVGAYLNSHSEYTVTYGKDYADNGEISEKYYMDVLIARELKLLIGDENGCFRPRDTLTRAEAVVATKRLMNIN